MESLPSTIKTMLNTMCSGAMLSKLGTLIHNIITAITAAEEDIGTIESDVTSLKSLTSSSSAKAKFTPEGGFAIKLINKTGAPSVKGEVVGASSSVNQAVRKIVKDVPDPIGVFYESNIADGQEAWVVIQGVADVYFIGNTTRGHLARGFLTADGASYVEGQALSEAVPSSPFASDKHFYEIGHVLQSRTGAGLALCTLHFN